MHLLVKMNVDIRNIESRGRKRVKRVERIYINAFHVPLLPHKCLVSVRFAIA